MSKVFTSGEVLFCSVSPIFAFVNGSSQSTAHRLLRFKVYSCCIESAQNLLQSDSTGNRIKGRKGWGLLLLNIFKQPYETVQYRIQNLTLSKSSTAKENPVQLQLAEAQKHIANSSLMQQPVRHTKCDVITSMGSFSIVTLDTIEITCTQLFISHASPDDNQSVLIRVCQGPDLTRDDSGMIYQPETCWSKS